MRYKDYLQNLYNTYSIKLTLPVYRQTTKQINTKVFEKHFMNLLVQASLDRWLVRIRQVQAKNKAAHFLTTIQITDFPFNKA